MVIATTENGGRELPMLPHGKKPVYTESSLLIGYQHAFCDRKAIVVLYCGVERLDLEVAYIHKGAFLGQDIYLPEQPCRYIQDAVQSSQLLTRHVTRSKDAKQDVLVTHWLCSGCMGNSCAQSFPLQIESSALLCLYCSFQCKN